MSGQVGVVLSTEVLDFGAAEERATFGLFSTQLVNHRCIDREDAPDIVGHGA